MCKCGRVFIGWFGLTILTFQFFSCQNISSTTLNGLKNKLGDQQDFVDTLKENTVSRKPLLLDKWDSLQKNLITFHVDSLHPVDIKTQKKNLKDSLRREFNKQPKHIFLTFDDGPLVGSAAVDSIARAKKIKVNTFLVGRHATMGKARKRDLDRYKENPYIACYNHSFTHAYNKFTTFYNNPASAYADFEKNEEDLGLKHKIVRLPGRNIWVYDDIRKIDLQSGSSTADLLHTNGY